MSLLPESATFHELVQECFVAYRGRGVSLSGKDVELVDAWAGREVPFEVVARGIRKAAEAVLFDAPGAAGQLRSLGACRRHVEREIDKYLKRSAGKTSAGEPAAAEEPFHLARHRKLLATLRKVAKEQPALAVPMARWLPRLPEPADLEASTRQEELVQGLLARALPPAQRIELLREARRLVQNAPVMTARARIESLRFHRAALLRHALCLPSFW